MISDLETAKEVQWSLEDIAEILLREDKFIVSFHTCPDYDAVGSSLALYHGLNKLGKEVVIVSHESKDVFDKNFSFLPGYQNIVPFSYFDAKELKYYILISLDSGDLKRLGHSIVEISRFVKNFINIDHHNGNSMFGYINYVETDVSCCSEIIYKLLKLLRVDIDINIAKCIYASIVGDSGSFRFDATKASTHEIAAKLLEIGVRPSEFTVFMFQNKTLDFLRFESEIFSRVKTAFGNKVIWAIITSDILDKYNLTEFETDGVLEDIGRIKDSVIYFTIKQKKSKGVISVGLRSKGDIDISHLAQRFGGGGHKNAAGFSVDIYESIEKIENDLLYEINKLL